MPRHAVRATRLPRHLSATPAASAARDVACPLDFCVAFVWREKVPFVFHRAHSETVTIRRLSRRTTRKTNKVDEGKEEQRNKIEEENSTVSFPHHSETVTIMESSRITIKKTSKEVDDEEEEENKNGNGEKYRSFSSSF